MKDELGTILCVIDASEITGVLLLIIRVVYTLLV